MNLVQFSDAETMGKEERRLLLGGKGSSLVEMSIDLGLSVPPGFIITTEAFHRFYREKTLAFLKNDIRDAMSRMELQTGRTFGGVNNPLLVSVRSGAPVSMPGMMDTILNLGLNDQTTQGLGTRTDKAFALQCRSRFGSMFDEIVIQKGEKDITEAPSDVWEQLFLSIEAVFESWNSPRAQKYREVENIPDYLGTAVTIQAMVFGNTGMQSGTGVLFTRNPSTGADELFGDYLPDAQGEDVVSGTHQTLGLEEMERTVPTVFSELVEVAKRLENVTTDMCDIEFTVEEGNLWILQSRIGKRTPVAAIRIAVEMAMDPNFPLQPEETIHRIKPEQLQLAQEMNQVSEFSLAIAKGLGASPGVATGQLVFTAEAAVEASDEGISVILVRPETSPADVHGMAVAQGIITATGGLASHAAVVARGWGIPAVVGVVDLSISDNSATFGEKNVIAGETVTFDGTTGEIFFGDTQVDTQIVIPAVEIFLTWVEEILKENQVSLSPEASDIERLLSVQSLNI
ncbi:MAG: pyruvate, phosphate dikinase [Acidimicrobiales bacterium]|nr:pyruvate, phosphate dikinase [Acidimicrobiales bacterium]